jgi:hypothetical protein
MSTTKVPVPEGRDDRLTRWAFNFFMGGIALAFVAAIVYAVFL